MRRDTNIVSGLITSYDALALKAEMQSKALLRDESKAELLRRAREIAEDAQDLADHLAREISE